MMTGTTENTSSPLVSVIVAVYNASPFLPQCLDSLQRQTLRNIQVICVDDASTDDSLNILRQHAANDPRFETIHLQTNQGQAHARNVALRQASGDYIAFLDSDDYFSDDALEEATNIFQRHEQTDCVLFNLVKFEDTTAGRKEEPYPMPAFEELDGREAFKKSLNWEIHGVYMARKKLYERFPFDDSSLSYSDDNTTRLHYYSSRKVESCRGTYYYRQHANSVTHRISVRRFDHLRACENMKQHLLQLNVDESTLSFYENRRWLVLVDLCMFYHFHRYALSKPERRYGLAEIKRVRAGIDRHHIAPHLKRKFGYAPMPSWWLFVFEEWCYFSLRGLLKRK